MDCFDDITKIPFCFSTWKHNVAGKHIFQSETTMAALKLFQFDPFFFLYMGCLQSWKIRGFQGYACSPATYVASTDAYPSAANSSHESVESTTKSASFPRVKDPISLSRKHAWAAEIVYLPCRKIFEFF